MRAGETAVVALGKFGGYEMTATSDLDLILIYDLMTNTRNRTAARPLAGRNILPVSRSG